MAQVTSRMTVAEYRKRAGEYISRIRPNTESPDLVDKAYALYLRRFFFGDTGEISYTFAGNTWKRREQRRELPFSKEEYIIKGA